jgi:hypothetical protein
LRDSLVATSAISAMARRRSKKALRTLSSMVQTTNDKRQTSQEEGANCKNENSEGVKRDGAREPGGSPRGTPARSRLSVPQLLS